MEHGRWRWVRIHIESVLVQYSGVPVVFPHKSAIRSDPPTKGMTRGHMRLSVPNIPPSVLAKSALRNVPRVLPAEAVQRIASFLSSGMAAILTGAGVSVDSGVKAYRGKDGRYMNPDYKYASLRCSSNLRDLPFMLSQTDFRAHCLQLSVPCLVNSVRLCSTRSS